VTPSVAAPGDTNPSDAAAFALFFSLESNHFVCHSSYGRL